MGQRVYAMVYAITYIQRSKEIAFENKQL